VTLVTASDLRVALLTGCRHMLLLGLMVGLLIALLGLAAAVLLIVACGRHHSSTQATSQCMYEGWSCVGVALIMCHHEWMTRYEAELHHDAVPAMCASMTP